MPACIYFWGQYTQFVIFVNNAFTVISKCPLHCESCRSKPDPSKIMQEFYRNILCHPAMHKSMAFERLKEVRFAWNYHEAGLTEHNSVLFCSLMYLADGNTFIKQIQRSDWLSDFRTDSKWHNEGTRRSICQNGPPGL